MADGDDIIRKGEFVTYFPEEGGCKRGTIVAVEPYMIMRDEHHNIYVVVRRAGRVVRCADVAPDPRPASSELVSRIAAWMRLHEPCEVPRSGEDITTPTGIAREDV